MQKSIKTITFTPVKIMKKSIGTSFGTISYSVYGKGTPVVFLHGFLGNSTIWNPFVEHLKKDYQVLTIDLPGHGETTAVQEEITMDFSAELVNEVLVQENISNHHLIGHSMGGYVASAFAKLYPKKINSLTFFNSTARGDSQQKQEDRLKAVRVFDMNPSIFINEAIKNLFYEKNLETFSAEVESLTQMAKNNSVKGAQGSLRGMRLREDNVEWLAQQDFPVHYIAGKFDNTVHYTTILEQVEITKAKLTTLENSGHMGFVEEKEKCLNAVEGFITL